jgi:hypothetical protein
MRVGQFPERADDEAPVLPDTAEFSIDVDWFNSQQSARGDPENFLNAAIRVAVIKTVSDIVLSAARRRLRPRASQRRRNSPTARGFGSTYVYGRNEAQIRLRGEPDDRRRLGAPAHRARAPER